MSAWYKQYKAREAAEAKLEAAEAKHKDKSLDDFIEYGQELHDSKAGESKWDGWWFERCEQWGSRVEEYLKGRQDPLYLRFIGIPFPAGAGKLAPAQRVKLKIGLQLAVLRDYRKDKAE